MDVPGSKHPNVPVMRPLSNHQPHGQSIATTLRADAAHRRMMRGNNARFATDIAPGSGRGGILSRLFK